jgi:hypoxanthine phosphoribosyltransferase
VTGAGQEATGTPQPIGREPAALDAARPPDEASNAEPSPASAVDETRFAHASEAEMARILDFYEVRWEYEPTTFPILWNLDGDVVESFAPDFYLPDLGVFLEMTTLKQRLVRKKNRKLRRLRELYPDIRIKLFYARDFRAMMLKYGRFGLAESLSGTLGQVVPDRDPPVDPDPATLEPLLGTALAADDGAPDAQPIVERPRPAVPAAPVRPAPRVRSTRRRRRSGTTTEAGAEREAGA